MFDNLANDMSSQDLDSDQKHNKFKEAIDKMLEDKTLPDRMANEVDGMSLEHKLSKFTGSSIHHRSLIPSIVMTDGIKFLHEHKDCFWLINLIAARQLQTRVARQEFQVWELSKGKLTLKDEDNREIQKELVTREFPLDNLTIWVMDKVMFLPQEY